MSYITKLPFEGNIKITYPYGVKDNNYRSGYHQGIDMVGINNNNVYSIVSGIVSYAGWENINSKNQGFGYYVSIKFDETSSGFKKVFFGHLSKINVNIGNKVSNATIIGIMGSTGFSTGSHTHVEIREYNSIGKVQKILNPANYMGIKNIYSTINSNDYKIETSNFNKYKVIVPSGINIRINYSTNSNRIDILPYNQEVVVNEIFKGNKWLWGKINYKGNNGWIALRKNDNSEKYAKLV